MESSKKKQQTFDVDAFLVKLEKMCPYDIFEEEEEQEVPETLDSFSKDPLIFIHNEYRKVCIQSLLIRGWYWHLQVKLRNKSPSVIGRVIGSDAEKPTKSSYVRDAHVFYELFLKMPRLKYFRPKSKTDISTLIKHKDKILEKANRETWWMDMIFPMKTMENVTFVDPSWLINL